MNDAFARLLAQTHAWFDAAVVTGWLDDTDRARLRAVERETPADLFAQRESRPLVVALFGGTGVGKSSLLNRLAGAKIARVGVERPTSREVTVYVHRDVELAALPPTLPLNAVHIERHWSAALRDVLWLDAPDIDSTEEANRRAALAWLPHVDLVCYVVSPERYRDDVGWRVLHTRGQKHGWVFVLNHWDEGDPQQADDLVRILQAAGFASPRVLRTSCRPALDRAAPCQGPGSVVPDEFDQLRAVIAELLAAHGVRELERLGLAARGLELRDAVQSALPKFGDDEIWERLADACDQHWSAASATIAEGAEWALRAAAGRFAGTVGGWPLTCPGPVKGWLRPRSAACPSEHEAQASASVGWAPPTNPSWLRPVQQALDMPGACQGQAVAAALWDDWTQAKVAGCIDAVEIAAGRARTVAAPLRQRLDAVAATAGVLVTQCARDHLRAALARPGSALGRLARRITGFLMTFLPALAVLWVAYAAIAGYHAATRGAAPFLGTPFAIHSAVVVLIAWLVPFGLDRLLRPALEQTALRALRAGLRAGLDAAGRNLSTALTAVAAEARRQREQAEALLRQGTRIAPPAAEVVAAIQRLVLQPPDRCPTPTLDRPRACQGPTSVPAGASPPRPPTRSRA
jgi:hypothetical protein